jgi:hypothetical protein
LIVPAILGGMKIALASFSILLGLFFFAWFMDRAWGTVANHGWQRLPAMFYKYAWQSSALSITLPLLGTLFLCIGVSLLSRKETS